MQGNITGKAEISPHVIWLHRASVTTQVLKQRGCWREWERKGGFEVREHREETEIMRDSGQEDIRAYSCAKGRQLVTEEG